MPASNPQRRRFITQAACAITAAGTLSAVGSAASAAGGAATPVAATSRGRGIRPAAANGSVMLGGDLPVHRLGFGAMRITGEGIWGEPRDAKSARAVLRRAVELGVNFIDTADAYGPDVSERLIAEALHPYPPGLIIATKGGMTRSGPNKWAPDCRPSSTCAKPVRPALSA